MRDVNMAANLERCVAEVLAPLAAPSGVIVSGDCACLKGLPEDYETFASLIRPLRESGLPVHLLMGNHDDRTHAVTAFGKEAAAPAPLENKHVTVIEDTLANWFLLDSLDIVNKTPGLLGEAQRTWLARELDARADKPAIIVVHHNVVRELNPLALQDSLEVLAMVRPRSHVKAVIYGHCHIWETLVDDSGIHLINLPPTGYIFKAGQPSGWVQATPEKGGLKLELRCLNPEHPLHGEVKDLAWRSTL